MGPWAGLSIFAALHVLTSHATASSALGQVTTRTQLLPRAGGGIVERCLPIGLITLLCIGAALRIYAYAANPSLWLDEASLAHNIIGRSFAGLLAPLDRQQVAPLGFLWLEKIAVSLFGTSEYALRLVPLLASLAALPLFAHLARRLLSPVAALFALAIFAVSIPLLYFAAETKQYSLDVTMALALFALALPLRLREQPDPHPFHLSPKRAAALAAVGAAAPWLSQPSVFALGGVGLYLMLPLLRSAAPERRRAAPLLGAIFSLWAVSGAASIIRSLSLISAADRADLNRFWGDAFLPLSSGLVASARWVVSSTAEIFGWFFPPLVATLALALFVLGIIALARRRDGTATLLLAPLGFALFASALRIYPLSYRLVLFTAPSLLLATGAGAACLLEIARSLAWPGPTAAAYPHSGRASGTYAGTAAWIGVAGLLALTVARSALALGEIPFYREELRPVVHYLAKHRESGDAIYVYYGAARAFEYYAPREGIPRSAYQVGRCWREVWRRYLDDVDALRGRSRVWLVLSHPFLKGGIREDSLFTKYFSMVGRRVDAMSAIGAELQLYDLSDSASTRDVRASFTPPTTDDSSYAAVGCVGGLAN